MNKESQKDPINLTVLIPLFNEEGSLVELCEWIIRVVTTMGVTYEILFIDDGSRDNSWQVIEKLATRYSVVRGVRFVRNYGKSPALHIGFQRSRGEVVVTMDADLQDSPDEIPELFRMIKEDGYDLVSGWKQKRYDPKSKTIPTKLFNATVRFFSGIKLHDFNCGLKSYRQSVVKRLEVYNDMHRFLPYMAKLAGFSNIGEKVVQHRARKYGRTKFGLNRFVNGYLDLLVLWFMGRYARKPMHIFGLLGTIMFLLGGVVLGGILFNKFICLQQGVPARLVTELPGFYVCLTTIILGGQLFLTGFLGEMISRQSHRRNCYSIEEEI